MDQRSISGSCPCSYNSSRFLEPSNYIIMHRKGEIWRTNIVFKHLRNTSEFHNFICWQSGDPLPMFAPQRLFYGLWTNSSLQSPGDITSMKYVSLLAPNCPWTNFFVYCRPEMQGRMYEWNEISWLQTSQSKCQKSLWLCYIWIFHVITTFSDVET